LHKKKINMIVVNVKSKETLLSWSLFIGFLVNSISAVIFHYRNDLFCFLWRRTKVLQMQLTYKKKTSVKNMYYVTACGKHVVEMAPVVNKDFKNSTTKLPNSAMKK
jgi:hypothetical protein